MAGGKRYDPRLKIDAINGFVPQEFKHIAKDWIVSAWKKEKWDKLIGYEHYNEKRSEVWELNAELHRLKQSVKKLKAEHELLSIINKFIIEGESY